jgi:hypothetical protein
MVDLGSEADFRWLEGVIGRKSYREEKDSACVGRVTLFIDQKVVKLQSTKISLQVP